MFGTGTHCPCRQQRQRHIEAPTLLLLLLLPAVELEDPLAVTSEINKRKQIDRIAHQPLENGILFVCALFPFFLFVWLRLMILYPVEFSMVTFCEKEETRTDFNQIMIGSVVRHKAV